MMSKTTLKQMKENQLIMQNIEIDKQQLEYDAMELDILNHKLEIFLNYADSPEINKETLISVLFGGLDIICKKPCQDGECDKG